MKFDVRSQVTQLLTAGKTKIASVQLTLATWVQSLFRFLKLRLSAITKLSPQSAVLQLLALGAAVLMVLLAIGGIQSIAQVVWSENTSESAKTTQAQQSASQASKQNWGGLPTAPPSPATSAQSPAQNSAPKKTAPTKAPAASSPKAPAVKPSPSAQASAAPQAISPVPPAMLTQSDAFMPQQQAAPADPTNYGDRYAKDIFGKPAKNDPLIVLHETVGSADSAINTFRTPHSNENEQSSYHSIIRRDGTVVYIVPPEKRAFGAGNSVFNGPNGQEAVRTHRQFPPSVNNFAYHISLETPPDGYNNAETHSGYTDAQYRSLAWLVAHTSVSNERVTTHQAIDQSGSRIDPRSFEAEKFFAYLQAMPRPYLNQGAAGG